jgi:hypothetical protein
MKIPRRVRISTDIEAITFIKVCQFLKIKSYTMRSTKKYHEIWLICHLEEILSIGFNSGKNQSIINSKSFKTVLRKTINKD